MKKTGYEWCLELNVRILRMLDWDTNEADCEESYFTEKIDSEEFYRRLELCKVKPNSQPRKTEMYLEYRMYGLVPYNLSPIQQGIQFGHAVVEFAQTVRDIAPFSIVYDKWANQDKTFIILNGGTTNNNPEKFGSLNNHLYNLKFNGVMVKEFYEPDLGDQLTAFVFLVDERVFNRELYPDFVKETLPWGRKKPSEKQLSELEEKNTKNYKQWVDKIGGETNAYLREYLRPLRLA